MTTIVATRTSILADSQASSGSPFKTNKLRVINTPEGEMLTGGCGCLTELTFLVNLIEKYGLTKLWTLHLGEHWPPRILKNGDTDVLVVTREKQIWMVDTQVSPMAVDMDWYTTGTGGDFARAAMLLGKTPHEAVEFSCENDPWSKGPVKEIRFKRQKRDTA